MALSDHEQRMFDEIQRQLVEEDPRFVARTSRRLRAWSPEGRLRIAVLIGVLGAVGVLGLTFDLLYGVVGMALLLAALFLGVGAIDDRTKQLQRTAPPDGR